MISRNEIITLKMDGEKFQKEIEEKLEQLTREQQVQFAWQCAVLTLPFLGAKGNFNYWKKKERGKNIYAIFYALDVSVIYNDIATAKVAASAAELAASAAIIMRARSTAFAATYAITSTYAINPYVAYAARSAIDATREFGKFQEYLANHIYKYLEGIQKGKEWSIAIEEYGPIWHNFQEALEKENCSYWGRLYQQVFENRLVLDIDALKRRINVPEEIRAEGAAAVGHYLEELEQSGVEQLNEARIIILGDKGVGKTCLARRLKDPKAPMTTDQESTPGVETSSWALEKENTLIRIWDFAGHTITHAAHRFFLSERCLYIMVYDGRTETRNLLEYWLNHMKNYGGDSEAIILVNQRDQHPVEIPINRLKEQFPILKLFTFSIQDNIEQLEEMRKYIAHYIQENPSWNKQEIAKSAYQVKSALEERFEAQGNDYISKVEFEKLAQENEVKNQEALLKSLHALGISLWYKDLEEIDTLVLNPEWISNGVYTIINWLNKQEQHNLNLSDIKTAFEEKKKKYPDSKHSFFWNLMKHYQLAFETKDKDELIIPRLLKEDRPEKLPEFPLDESLMLKYQAEIPLPPDSISRFIVTHHRQIKKDGGSYWVWRHGVVLQDGKESIALVREKERSISVSVRGEEKTEFLSKLRDTLNEIFDTYKSERPELQYRIERFGKIPQEVEAKNPLWLPEQYLVNHHLDNVPYYDPVTRQRISTKRAIEVYNIQAERVILGKDNAQILGQSIYNTFNFKDCNIDLQGSLNEMSGLLAENEKTEEAIEVANVAKALEKVEKAETEEAVKKSGIANKVKRFIEELESKDSNLNKAVKGLKNGIGIAQDIAAGYNEIAQWVGMPVVPKPFLKKKK